MTDFHLSRREAFTTLGAGGALIALPGCARTIAATAGPATEAEATALLDSIGENLLWTDPEQGCVASCSAVPGPVHTARVPEGRSGSTG